MFDNTYLCVSVQLDENNSHEEHPSWARTRVPVRFSSNKTRHEASLINSFRRSGANASDVANYIAHRRTYLVLGYACLT